MTKLETRESATEPSTTLSQTTQEAVKKDTAEQGTGPIQNSAKGSVKKKVQKKAQKKAKDRRRSKVFRAIARHPRLTTAAILLTAAGSTGVVLLYLLFKGAWSQHRDNVAILHSILKMELGREDTIALNNESPPGEPQQVVTRTYLTLEPYVEHDGWMWINRFGSTITYGKQDKRLIASCSPYSPLYLVCDLSEIP